MIVTILSMSVRTGLQAYSRGRTANEKILTMTAVEGLMQRQLRALAKRNLNNFRSSFFFQGEKHRISFLTTHVPLGSLAGGIFKVCYLFDEDNQRLIYGQLVITRIKDINKHLPEHVAPDEITGLMEEGWAISMVDGIRSLNFAFTDSFDYESEPEDWEDEWTRTGRIPEAAAISLVMSQEKEDFQPAWKILHVEPLTGTKLE